MSCIKPRIAVTTGDCAGIGPELVLHALNSSEITECADLTIYSSLPVLRRVSHETGIPLSTRLAVFQADEDPPTCSGHYIISSCNQELKDITPAKIQAACGKAAARWIEQAVKDTLGGKADALVTGPINKASLNLAGVSFPGHTEMLASLCGCKNPCMSFFTPGLIISLATTHTSITSVSALLSIARLVRVVKLTNEACIKQGIENPHIGLLALNPHAGENSLFGEEEVHIIEPAIADARRDGINVSGPLVPDTAFVWLYPPKKKAPFDAYIAMYHDQALIPFKMAAFDKGVNVTLGLPMVRTSPDHGTAFDLAWQGKASPNSLFEAIRLAAKMAG